jgi:hypothetical protein
MRLPRRQFLHLAAGAASLPAMSRRTGWLPWKDSNRSTSISAQFVAGIFKPTSHAKTRMTRAEIRGSVRMIP